MPYRDEGQLIGIFDPCRPGRPVLGVEKWGARLSEFEGRALAEKFAISFISTGRVLVGRSSDRIAMVDHPEPLIESVSLKAKFLYNPVGGQDTGELTREP